MNAPISLGNPDTIRLPRQATLLMRMLEQVEGGSIRLTFPNGSLADVGHGQPVADLVVNDWDVFGNALSTGSIGFGEDYIRGNWQTDHLADLLTLLARNRPTLARAIHGKLLSVLIHRLWHALRRNTRSGARRNIAAHYDLGNEFYALWLDETMSYSSALFSAESPDLASAQRAKYRRILRRLGAQPGARILEIGCGWGGFAEVAALEFGCYVEGLTLSPAQRDFARRRADRSGFADRASFELRDYRDAAGRYDHIVSIEMFEAVGERYWPAYFTRLRELLAPGGKVLVQVITIADTLFAHYRRDVDFIQRYVFPGGMLPAPSVFVDQATRAGLAVTDDLRFGADYARTLAQWHERFNAALPVVRGQGFGEEFIRMWQFYLAYCEAGFRAGSTDVHQFELGHAR